MGDGRSFCGKVALRCNYHLLTPSGHSGGNKHDANILLVTRGAPAIKRAHVEMMLICCVCACGATPFSAHQSMRNTTHCRPPIEIVAMLHASSYHCSKIAITLIEFAQFARVPCNLYVRSASGKASNILIESIESLHQLGVFAQSFHFLNHCGHVPPQRGTLRLQPWLSGSGMRATFHTACTGSLG